MCVSGLLPVPVQNSNIFLYLWGEKTFPVQKYIQTAMFTKTFYQGIGFCRWLWEKFDSLYCVILKLGDCTCTALCNTKLLWCKCTVTSYTAKTPVTLVAVIAWSWILNFVHEAGLSVLSCILKTDAAPHMKHVQGSGLRCVGGYEWVVVEYNCHWTTITGNNKQCLYFRTWASICNGFHCNVISSEWWVWV